ncbi:MECDP-synthase [Marinobacter sp. F4206]|uniref:MECDP-synthase n=1 Tax=Marinobacter sp. F4206 TaxID=2861777 RepID=UPI001C5DB333|nr:MECDP-synthase [Marinobacter sp. F4206]MBW4936074.1 MECDP-synthase [Marinobacter sp. F4206]
MFKKTLISVAVASSLGLSGCFDSGDSGANANPDYRINDTTIDRSIVRPIYDPNPIAEEPAFPINSDLILLLGATQSANYDFTGLSTGTTPADDAVNRLSGFSTSGAFTLKFDGSLNKASVVANATVFVLPLNVNDAVEGVPEALPNTNPSSINEADPFQAPTSWPSFRADVVSVDGGTDNAIRVVPLKPLLEDQKYLVVATNDIVGANGKPIARSVQDVQLADGVLGNSALGNVKSLLQASDALANGFLAEAIPDDTPESALAYTFTTNADTDVLRAMMAPAEFGTALGQKVGFTAQLKAVQDNYPTLNFSQLTTKLGELAELAAGLGTTVDPADLSAQELSAITALGQAQALTAPADIEAAITAEVGDTLHLPSPRPNIILSNGDAIDLATIDSLDLATNPIAQAATQIKVSQGAITLPYFQHLPGADGRGLVDGYWKGSTSLEADLNESLTGSASQDVFRFLRDIDGQLNVNGYFPFPQKQADITVPTTVYYPDPANAPAACGAGTDPVGVTIFQHGITTDRSAAMLPAILIANQACQAVVTIDLPLHGLGGSDAAPGQIPGLAPLDGATLNATLDAAIGSGSLPPELEAQLTLMRNSDYAGERHFNYTADESLNPVSATSIGEVESGSLFINPLNMMGSSDNLRQAVVDLLNVTATLQTMDINGDFAPDLAGLPVNFAGNSLGGIVGATFSSLNNDATLNASLDGTLSLASGGTLGYPPLSSVVLHNAGSQVTRLIENSPAFSTPILGGLAEQNVTQGSSDFESFFYVFQSVVDAGDPVSFVEGLGSSTSNLLLTEVTGDTVVPNEANVNTLGEAFSAPLAGTEPMLALIDQGIDPTAGNTLADNAGLSIMDSSTPNSAGMPLASFFDGTNPCSDANHGTIVSPIQPNEACPGGVSDTTPAFTAMIAHTVGAISGGAIPGADAGAVVGADVAAAINASLGESETLPKALDQN